MAGRMIVAVDVDGVIADMMGEILTRYNKDYDDHLANSDIKAWDIALFVKPECGEKIYEYFENPAIYGGIVPLPGAQSGVRSLREAGHRVVFVSAATNGTMAVKESWLMYRGFLTERRDYIICQDKYLIRADVLIDDGVHNLINFPGERIIFSQPWNANDSVDRAYRAADWPNAHQIVQLIWDMSKVEVK